MAATVGETGAMAETKVDFVCHGRTVENGRAR